MKKKIALIVFSVFWKMTFSLDAEKPVSTFMRSAHFDTIEQRDKFIERAPKGWFECTESRGGRQGFCLISEMVPL